MTGADGAETADIVVVGGGPGGCAAALEGARNGASVVLLEADDRIGGNAARSTGYLAFQGFGMQREAGIRDSVERFLADMEAEVELQKDRYGLIFDAELARVFAKESSATYDLLVDIGFTFGRFIPRPTQHTTDRMVDVSATSMFTTCFEAALSEAGVEVRTNVRARRLVSDGGAVVGVQTDDGRVDATRGVVLAAGGYQANPDLRARYQPGSMAATPYLGTSHARGDGHLMGQAMGGDLINMTMIPPLIMVASALVEESIAVNELGQRFHDEAGPYDQRVAALRRQPGELAWFVFDDHTARRKRQLVEEMPEAPVTGSTLEHLGREVGCDPDTLVETVEVWNDTVTTVRERDPAFGRVVFPEPRRGIEEAPFHASRMVIGINFPAGGFRVTSDTQVLDVFGEPIPGLFAVGDCVGGISPTIGLGGMKISAALTLGRIAGRSIATGAGHRSADRGPGDVPALASNRMRIAVVDE